MSDSDRAVFKVAGGATVVTLVGGGLAVSGQIASAATFQAANEAELEQAILDANASVGVPDTIEIGAATITLTSALPVITDELTIVGAGAASTILDGAGAYRLFYAASGTTSLTIQDLTIRNGYASTFADPYGGGVKVVSSSLTLDGVTVSDNRAYVYGGGVQVIGSPGDTVSVTVTDSVFSDNEAMNSDGAGLRVKGYGVEVDIVRSTFTNNNVLYYGYGGAVAVLNYGDPIAMTVVDSTFVGNSALGGSGAVYVNAGDYATKVGGTVTISGSTFELNLTDSNKGAGAVWLTGIDVGTLTDSTFYANATSNQFQTLGGALAALYTGSFSIDGSTFVGNSSTGSGGAIWSSSGYLTVTDSTFTGNDSGGSGGAIYSDGYFGTTIQNSTFDGNTANYRGGAVQSFAAIVIDQSTFTGNSGNYSGAIHSYVGSSSMTIRNSTIVGNTATVDGVGGVYVYGFDQSSAAEIVNTVIADNVGATAPTGQAVGVLSVSQDDLGENLYVGTITVDHSLVESSVIDVEGAGVGNLVGIDPQVGGLADNGGGTLTILPLAGSPLIDAGDSAVASFPTDQRGETRVVGDAIDIGATEVQPEPVESTTTTVAPTTVPGTTAPSTSSPDTTSPETTAGPTTTLGPAVLPPTGGGGRTGVVAALLTGLGAVLTLGTSRRRRAD